MGIFHFKGKLISQNNNAVFYQFYPEYLSAEEVFGEFKIDVETWQWEITKKSEPVLIIIMPSDEKVASSLTYKVKKLFGETNKLPEEVFWIA